VSPNIFKHSLFLRLLLLVALTICFPSLASAVNLNEPLPSGGVVFKYDIFYKGDKVGQHQMRAIPDGDLIRLEHSRNIEVKVAFITAFSESHKSTELWSKSVELQKLNAKTQINGKEIAISGQNSPKGFIYVIDGVQSTAPVDLVTLDSYWVGNAPKRTTVMDVAGGKMLKTSSNTNSDGSISLVSDKFNAKFIYQGDFLAVGELTQNGNTVVYKIASGN
jgi:hypothetical protein